MSKNKSVHSDNDLKNETIKEFEHFFRALHVPKRLQEISEETLLSQTGFSRKDFELWGTCIENLARSSVAWRYVSTKVPENSKMAQESLTEALKWLNLKAIIGGIPDDGTFHLPMSEYAKKELGPFSAIVLEAQQHIQAAIKKLVYVQQWAENSSDQSKIDKEKIGRSFRKVPELRVIASGLLYWAIRLRQGSKDINAKGAWCLYYLKYSEKMPNLTQNSVKEDDACRAFATDVKNMNKNLVWKPNQPEKVSMKQALTIMNQIVSRLDGWQNRGVHNP